MKNIKVLFGDKVLGSVAIFSLFCCGMLGTRVVYAENANYLFLVWNLFLAVLPLGMAMYFKRIYQSRGLKSGRTISALIVWLIFFPNSPYIITDLIHIANSTGDVPIWYDALMIFSFALCGVYGGFLSLSVVWIILKKYIRKNYGSLYPAVLFLLTAYGIYLGRVLRWNSWDLVTRPHRVVIDMWLNFADPAAWGITIFFGFFLMFAWQIFSSFADKEINRLTDNEPD